MGSSSSELETTLGEAPTWLKNELKEGIIRGGEDRDDSEDDDGDSEEADSETEETDNGKDREKSKLTVASTADNASDSDRNSKSAATKLAEKVERFKQSRKSHSETRIVGGVAINTVGNNAPLSVQSSAVSVKSEPELDSIQDKDTGSKSTKGTKPDSKESLNLSKVFPRPASSPATSKHKRSSSDGMIIDEKTRTTSDSGVELTPVEKFNSSSEGSGGTASGSRKPSLDVRTAKKSTGSTSPQAPRSPRVGERHMSKSVDRYVEYRRPVGRARYSQGPSRKGGAGRSTDDKKMAASDARSVLTRREQAALDELRRESAEKHASLQEEIQKLRLEKEQNEQRLQELHQKELEVAEKARGEQEKEAKEREEKLSHEVLNLKMELSKQFDKLQDNYNVVLSLQEQLSRMQQEQLRHQAKEKRQNSARQKPTARSSVCRVM